MDQLHTNQKRHGHLLVVTWLAVVPPAILIAIYLNLPAYAFTLDARILPKYFYFVFALLLAPLVLLKIKSFTSYLVSPIAVWAISLLALNCVHLFADVNGSTESTNLILSRIQMTGLIILLGFAFTRMRRDVYENIFVLLAFFLPCAIIADFLYPGFFYSADSPGVVLGRAAGPFINANNASEAILILFVLACPTVSKKYRSPLIILCGVGVLLTFSRAAMGAWLVIFVYLLFRHKISRFSALMALIVVAIPLLLGGMESYLQQRSDLDQSIENIENRLMFLSNRRFDDESAIERAAVFQAGWEAFVRNPVTGVGAGTTMHASGAWPYHASTHNQLAFLAAEYGIPGVVAWCWLGFCLMRGRYFHDKDFQRLALIFFISMTPFTHNMFDLPYWLLTFMLVARQPAKAQGRNAVPIASFVVNRNV